MMRYLTKYLLFAAIAVTLCGCADSKDKPKPETVEEEVNEQTERKASKPDKDDDKATGDESKVSPALPVDENVYLELDYDNMTAVIVDGNEKMPVEISMGGSYEPDICKCDVDNDGQYDYLITECEGSGTGFSVYGLCILKKADESYDFHRYPSSYFAEILEDRISYSYDTKSKTVMFDISNDNETLHHSIILDYDSEIEKVIWSDIIRIELIDGRPYLKAPSGYIYTDIPMPDYENALEVTAPIYIGEDISVTVGDITSDNPEKSAFILYDTSVAKDYDDIRELPSDYTSEQAQSDGCFVIGAMVHNEDRYVSFVNDYKNDKAAFIRVYQSTVEGDPVIYDLFYLPGSKDYMDAVYDPTICVIKDNTRDEFSAQSDRKITYEEYEGITDYKIDGQTYWVAYRGDKEKISLDSEDTFVIAFMN